MSTPHSTQVINLHNSDSSLPPHQKRHAVSSMTTLIRKVWESVSNRKTSTSSSFSETASSSLGVFDPIPTKLLMQILRVAGPKLSVVCKGWRSLAADSAAARSSLGEHLISDPVIGFSMGFDSEYFVHKFRQLWGEVPQLPLMSIYGQRTKVPGAVIIDGGSGYCKFGWSRYACPSGRSATFVEFGNVESPLYSRLRHFFGSIYSRMHSMQVKPHLQPVVVSIPICHYDDTESAKASRQQLKEAIYRVLFDMNVPFVCAINQATLALYAARRTSGIVVNIGFHVTSVVPILNGKVMWKVGVEVMGLGALKLTGFLRELMQQNNINFEPYTIRTIKEQLCYVAADYEAELTKNTQASFGAGGEGWFTLSKERFQTGEILFQPRLAGVRTMGLHQAVALCMDHCHQAEVAELTADDSWFKTVVLAGGSACLPGLAERLKKELHGLLPPSVSNGVTVIPPPFGADTAWFGAKLISNLSTFPGPWCITKKQFKQKSKGRLW